MYNREYTPERITELKSNEIFVFGSNLAGAHGGGAAQLACNRFGAVWGEGVGLQGQSYAIPTMQGGVETIKPYVDEFILYYHDGIAYVSWMLYPDGRYFSDEDGFGMEDNDEVNISAYIDTQCQVVVKFQDMEDSEKRKQQQEEAIKRFFEYF